MVACKPKQAARKRKEPLFDAEERAALLPPRYEHPDEWAERVVRLPGLNNAISGPIDLNLTPYLRRPLRCAADPEIEEITACMSTQVGKTTFMLLTVLYRLANDPVATLHVSPRQEDAEATCRERYAPVIRESPELLKLFPNPEKDLAKNHIQSPKMVINCESAGSPRALAQRAVGLLVMDELDKWDEWSGKEADPVELARERTATYHYRKILKVSTPTTDYGYISKEYAASTGEKYWVPCHRCGGFQLLVFGDPGPTGAGVKWPENATADEIYTQKLAYYQCELCGRKIEDGSKREMLIAGMWVPKECQARDGKITGPQRKSTHVGFHLWAAYSNFRTFSDIAARFKSAGNLPNKVMNFRNSWLAATWKLTPNELHGAMIRKNEDTYPRGSAPAGAWLLTAGVDVQRVAERVYLYYVIRAWGKEGESWLVKCGTAEGWVVLHQILFQSHYRTIGSGDVLPLHAVVIDSGDGNTQEEVYDICYRWGVSAYKGASHQVKETIRKSDVPYEDGHITLFYADTNVLKGELHRQIRGSRWHLHSAIDEEYYRQMAVEQQVTLRDERSGRYKTHWKCIPEGAANHYFDCEVMAQVGVRSLEAEHLATEPPRPDFLEKTEPVRPEIQVYTENFFSRGI